jgi:hypothetical protein
MRYKKLEITNTKCVVGSKEKAHDHVLSQQRQKYISFFY